MDGGDFNSARGYLNQAKKIQDTPEVNGLLGRVEDKLKSP